MSLENVPLVDCNGKVFVLIFLVQNMQTEQKMIISFDEKINFKRNKVHLKNETAQKKLGVEKYIKIGWS